MQYVLFINFCCNFYFFRKNVTQDHFGFYHCVARVADDMMVSSDIAIVRQYQQQEVASYISPGMSVLMCRQLSIFMHHYFTTLVSTHGKAGFSFKHTACQSLYDLFLTVFWP